MSIKVTCEVTEYSDKPNIRVHSNWAEKRKVEIEVFAKGGEPLRYTVVGSDLIEAIRNCMNTNDGW